MTLIVSCSTLKYFVQASDRRLSTATGVIDNYSTKSIVVRCIDGTLALSYSGLAFLGPSENMRSDVWLLNVLGAMKATSLTARQVVENLRPAIWNTICETPGPWQGKDLTIAVGGFLDTGRPVWAKIGNAFALDETTGERVRSKVILETRMPPAVVPPDKQPQFLYACGSNLPQHLQQRLFAQHKGGVYLSLTPSEVADELVELIREAADDQSTAGSISKDCLSVIITPDGGATSKDHRVEGGTYTVAPHLAAGPWLMMDIEMGVLRSSPSARVPVDEWPVLDARVAFVDMFVAIENKSDWAWADVRLDVNGAPCSFGELAEGRVESSGYIYQLPTLAAHGRAEFGKQALRRIPDGISLRLETVVNSAILTARLPSGEFGIRRWSLSDCEFAPPV